MSIEPATQESACHGCHHPPNHSKLYKSITTICRIALAVFACYISPHLFACTFAIGIAWGLYDAWKHPQNDAHQHVSMACLQVEHLAGERFPDEMTLVCVTALTITHMLEHNPEVSVLLIGIAIGKYAGKQAGYTLWHQGRTVEARVV